MDVAWQEVRMPGWPPVQGTRGRKRKGGRKVALSCEAGQEAEGGTRSLKPRPTSSGARHRLSSLEWAVAGSEHWDGGGKKLSEGGDVWGVLIPSQAYLRQVLVGSEPDGDW